MRIIVHVFYNFVILYKLYHYFFCKIDACLLKSVSYYLEIRLSRDVSKLKQG